MLIDIIRHIDIFRAVNLAKVLSSYHISSILGKPVVWGLPASFSVEPTNYCNLKCPECPSGTGKLTRPKGFLSQANFKKFIDEIKSHAFYVQLFFQGEPYLNKELTEMIDYARQNNIFTSISTNGLLLTEKNIDHILCHPPNHLIYSLDGIDKTTYENYRVGGSFEKAHHALKKLTERKHAKGQKYPYIELQFLVMKQNEHQIPELKKLGKELGVDKISLKSMQVYSYEDALKFLPEREKFRRYTLRDGELKLKGKLPNRCIRLWQTSVITWDGMIVPCCFDKDAVFKLGNLGEKSFAEIWRSQKFMKFREKIVRKRIDIPFCNNCTEGLKI